MQDFSKLILELAADTEALEAERAKADALFLGIGDGALATDEKGNISRVNAIGAKMLGYSVEELMGKWYPKTVTILNEQGKVIPTIERPITKAFLTGKPVSARGFFKKKDGSTFPVSLTTSPVILDGKPIGAMQVFTDITREYEVDKMKSEFISLASHQLRTPLAAIMTNSHLLGDGYAGVLTDEQQAFMDNIIFSVDRMHELISTLLNITRIEGGKMSVSPRPTDMKKLIRDVTMEVTPGAEEKKLLLKADLKPIKLISTDPMLAREVIANLLSNAVKYTPGKGHITVNLSCSKKEVLFSVADSGYGIPKKQQQKIFTKFFRADNIVQTESVGTGLGLYMIKGITENLGGKIWFESQEGKGSTFYFSLPLTGSPEKLGTTKLESSTV